MKTRYLSGRVVGIFGLPCSGKSTLIDTIIQSSKEILAKISSGDIARKLSQDAEIQHMAEGNLFPHEDKLREEMLSLINKRRSSGAEIIILDGFPRTIDQCQWLLDNQLVGTDLEGCLIQVCCDQDDLINRATHRNRDKQDTIDMLSKKITKQRELIDQMETLIFRLAIPYYTIMNISLEAAATQMVKYLGLRK